jgi:hypothetical protein
LLRLVQEGFDFALVLDDGDCIAECVGGRSEHLAALERFVGRPLEACVGPESRAKVPGLLAADCLGLPQGYRWRHLNLLLGDDDGLPVLLKLVVLGREDGTAPLRVLVGRDLSPLRDIQQRFVNVSREFEFVVSSLTQSVPVTEAGLLQQVGRKPLNRIVGEAVGYLERSCLALALARSGGDRRAAALLLGLGLDDFNARYELLVRD